MNVDRNEFFRQATIRICGSLEIETALAQCFDYLKAFLPITGIHLILYEQDRGIARVVASLASEGLQPLRSVLSFPEQFKNQMTKRWLSIKEIEVFNQPAADPDLNYGYQQAGWSLNASVIVMRLELEGHRVGVLLVSTEGVNCYTPDHARLLLLLHEPFAIAMANALRHQEVLRLKDLLAEDNRDLRRQLLSSSGTEVIGAEFGLCEVMRLARQVAQLDTPVLLLGESGVGKEVIANVIHQFSPRKDGPLVKVNSGAIPDTLLDSELFGHEKGAFTGAISQKRGRFERADKGTIFLDEIGELPLQAQVRLLRVLQQREIERVGGTKPVPVDTRLIAATHRNLQEMIKSGQFREDLWFRLNVFPITIPLLRDHPEDIPALVDYFLDKKSQELRITRKITLGPGAMEQLKAYKWPGNVRELQNIIERALIRDTDGRLHFDDLSQPQQTPDARLMVKAEQQILPLDEVNASYILQVSERTHGKINGPGGAAELLGIHPNTLRKRLAKLGIPYRRKERT
ncbi:sigma-54 dependent DNA-binding response regulator [Candidatus Vecturithrix granuli]|uniref:Sigma-54 dependent DNA-binding response regulator n=1 Tax=Vecturithrix granuli TaxID=1499967 RepID=A0A081BUG4_VECG1|nr:sigma-54 dependent DNA-binding response regulator [Candidatus Vecturithrix granuli]